jgi:hypothetical protein
VSWATWAFLQLGGRPGRSEDIPHLRPLDERPQDLNECFLEIEWAPLGPELAPRGLNRHPRGLNRHPRGLNSTPWDCPRLRQIRQLQPLYKPYHFCLTVACSIGVRFFLHTFFKRTVLPAGLGKPFTCLLTADVTCHRASHRSRD